MTETLTVLAPPVLGGLLALVLLRVQAGRLARELERRRAIEGVAWTALCRVLADGMFLDGGRSRRSGGPRGVLAATDFWLEYRPDARERRLGDATRRWSWDDIEVRECRRRRDVSGIGYSWCRIAFPEGQAVIAVFTGTGTTPSRFGPR